MKSLRHLCVAALAAVLFATAACTPSEPAAEDPGPHGEFGKAREYDDAQTSPPKAVVPPPPRLDRDPQTSVYSYLLWISYAYRVADSNVATMAFSPYEEVRVNSYVQYNKQERRAIDQQLIRLDFKEKQPKASETTATVVASEEWKYRYIDMNTGKYKGPWNDASYDSTYTVVFDKKRSVWLVDKVEATAKGEVK